MKNRDQSFVDSVLPEILQSNKHYIIKELKSSEKPLSDKQKNNALFMAFYKREDLLVETVIKIILQKRQEVCLSFSNSEQHKEGWDLVVEYMNLLLHFIKEQAFNDPLVCNTFDFLRKNNFNDLLKSLLQNLWEGRIAEEVDWMKLTDKEAAEKLYKILGKITQQARKIVSVSIEQLRDKHAEYHKDIQSSFITKPLRRWKRIFATSDLTIKEEAMLYLQLAKLPYEYIGEIMGGISKQAVSDKLHLLWQKPKVRIAHSEAVSRVKDDLRDDELSKSKKARTHEFEDADNPSLILSSSTSKYYGKPHSLKK